MPQEPTPIKGDEIYIASGSYKGRKAWKNEAKKHPPKSYYVIVDMGDGTELTTRILRRSVGVAPEPPTSYEEAAVQQIPDIQYHLKKAAYHLAKCQINDWEELACLFQIMCLEAQVELETLGPKAAYYNVQY